MLREMEKDLPGEAALERGHEHRQDDARGGDHGQEAGGTRDAGHEEGQVPLKAPPDDVGERVEEHGAPEDEVPEGGVQVVQVVEGDVVGEEGALQTKGASK